MAVKLVINERAISDKVKGGAARGCLKAAHIWHAEYIRLILKTSKSGRIYTRRGVKHRASAPGEPPASDTGALVRSARVRAIPNQARAHVVIGASYARRLELEMNRPALGRALKEKRQEMIRTIRREMSKAT
jgi:hypothetical protein